KRLEDESAGAAAITVSLAPVTTALAKKADTSVTLDTLHLLLTSPGCPSRDVVVPVSGDIHAASQSLTATVAGLQPLRNWKVKAWSRDLVDSVVHIDSTTFYVEPGATAAVPMRLNPRFSVLVARFVSTSATVTKIEKLVLRVNGTIVDDTTFSSKKAIFDVRLSHKYLKAGIATTLRLEALDRASPARVKYSKTFSLTPTASLDTTLTVKLQ
ncbi:MAG TPA: hypothetical protein VK465_13535, partial [Fibrobacteria bacterium]|nr:hypothetical protein [Fibrobacteria bacterium]